MFRHLSMPALLVASAILSAVGCQACNSCYDYSSPVADCQCGCGCQRAGSVHCDCNSSDCNSGDCASGGCVTGNCSASGEGTSGPVMMEEGPVSQGSVQQGPMPQSMAPSGGSMNYAPASPQ